MRFTLQNLGRLEQATIDLGKDLIVLTGPNNTSKTYVAHAIYGFFRRHPSRFTFQVLAERIARDLPKQAEEGASLDVDLIDLARAHVDFVLEHASTDYRARLRDVFASDPAFVSRAKTEVTLSDAERDDILRSLLALDSHDSDAEHAGRYGTVHKHAGSSTFTVTPTTLPLMDGGALDSVEAPTLALPSWQRAAVFAASSILNALFGLREPYILTAERNAILLFSHELSLKRSDLVNKMLRASDELEPLPDAEGDPLRLLHQGARLYPIAIRDSLRLADTMGEGRKRTSKGFAPVASDLERDILGGTVHVTDDGEMRFRPTESGADLGLHLASSSVKSVASLSFYLRHLAQKGHFLIIDEPELNLHPDNQRRIARLLARLSRSGIKVMISTHSDYIVRELNNLIMLSSDTEGKLLEQFGYSKEETLDPARVGAYLFKPTGADPIPVEASGFDAETMDREIHGLNRSAQRIYYTLFDK